MNKKSNNISNKLKSQASKVLGAAPKSPEQVHYAAVSKRRRHISKKAAGILISAFIVLIAALSLFVLNHSREDAEPAEESTEPSAAFDEEALNTNLLLVLSQTESENLLSLARLNIDTQNKALSLFYIPTDEYSTAAGLTSTLSGHFNKGGINQLKQALITKEEFAPARYIHLSEDQLSSFLSSLGSIEVNIENDISFLFDGISIVIEKGEGARTADTLMKYICYLCTNIEGNEEELGEIVSKIFASFFSPDDPEYFMNMYLKVVNGMDTDISSADVQGFANSANELFENGATENIKLIKNGE